MQRRLIRAIILAAALSGTSGIVSAETGLPLPRFVSMRADEVNVRTGPGVRYPIDWVFVRKDMPVEIIGEYDTWRRIRDWTGTSGWVHQSMLSGHRTVMTSGDISALHKKASSDAPVVARSEAGVVGDLLKCEADWCEVELTGHRGWVERSKLWGVYPEETID